jgi:stage II sporulation protein D
MVSQIINPKLKIQNSKFQCKIKNFGFQLIILIFTFYILNFNCYAQSTKYIRVAIIQDAESLSLQVNGSYEIIDSLNQKILSSGKDLKTTVTIDRKSILLGGMSFNTDKVLIKSDGVHGNIIIDGRRFRGDIQLIKKDNLRLLVANHLDLEDYIKGVLYHEVSHYWPFEVLKAQAIVCRTYALYQIQQNAAKDYDVTSDIYSQVYGGRTSERYRTNEAVDETKAQVLTYQDTIFPTYYHATCGGHTEDASILWNIDLVPLKGVACNFCKDSPHFKWHQVLSLYELRQKLVNAGYQISDIKDIVILGRDKSKRITELKIITDQKEIRISGKDFRNIIDSKILRSANFKVNVVNRDVVFEGLGWGHGVGMCQWGAYFMAKKGYNYKEILRYYYPSSQISSINNY